MGVPEGVLSLEQFLEIATEYGNELVAKEKAAKERLAREKAQKALQETMRKRIIASDMTSRVLGASNRIDPSLWTFANTGDGRVEVRLDLHGNLRLVYLTNVYGRTPDAGRLVIQRKVKNRYSTTYTWDEYGSIKIESWDDFCRAVAANPPRKIKAKPSSNRITPVFDDI